MPMYNTGNPVGSTAPKDLYDNTQVLDKLVVGTDPMVEDRLGNLRYSWAGMEYDFSTAQTGREAQFQAFLTASGFSFIGDYGPGLVFTSRSQYTIRDGYAYRLAPGTTVPYTTTGNWALESGNFLLFESGDVLRQDLSLQTGSRLVGGAQMQFLGRADIRSVPGRYDGDEARLLGMDLTDPSLIQGQFRWSATSTASDNGGTVFAVAGVATGRWLREFDGPAYARWFHDEAIDWRPTILAALAVHTDVVIDRNCSVTPPVTVISNRRLIGENGVVMKALVTGPHILSNASSAKNVTLENIEVDGDNIRGLNGFGMGTVEALPTSGNLRVLNCVARNCKRSPATGGGRGFTTQGNTDGIVFENPRAFDCTTGYDISGGSGLGAVIGAHVVGVAYAENCQEAVSVYSDGVGTVSTVPATDPSKLTAVYQAVFARNCGRTTDTVLYSGSGAASDQDGGVVVMRRGRNTVIEHLTVFNDLTYTAGAILRGTGGNVQIKSCEVWGNFNTGLWIGTAENLLPIPNSNDASYGIVFRGRLHSSMASIANLKISTGANFMTGCEVSVEVDAFAYSAPILVTAAGGLQNNNNINVKDLRTGRVLNGDMATVLSKANTLTLAGYARTDAAISHRMADIQLDAGICVDFSTTFGGAGALEGYVQVKVGGVLKKIPYHAV